jgi:hypothetical protein
MDREMQRAYILPEGTSPRHECGMLFSRGIDPAAERDLQRILEGCGPAEAALVREAWDLLVGILRFDPHLQGQGPPGSPFCVVTCGPIRVFYRLRPLEDRYVDIAGVGRNPDWVL